MANPKSALRTLMQKAYALVLAGSESLLGQDRTKELDARFRFRRTIDLKNPKTLADKVSWLSLHGISPLAVKCTDKWDVREYVAQKGLAHTLIPVYGEAVSRSEDVDFAALPQSFVLKATHSCRMNIVCTDKATLDIPAARKTMDHWLATTYGTYSMEPHYRSLPHRVYCEACLGAVEEMVDYKIHCIHGKPTFILVCNQRGDAEGKGSAVAMQLFDLDWNPIDGLRTYGGHRPGDSQVEKPANLEEMLTIARKLSEDFPFVRVDLYNVRGKIYFGELTFTPANGIFASYQDWLLAQQGELLHI